MRIRDAYPTIRDSLEATGQVLERLEPWEAWRTFKHFLHSEIEDGYDAASLQFDLFPDESLSAYEATLLLVRQFSERGAPEGDDELLGRVVLEFRYPAGPFHAFRRSEVWTLDFSTLEEWASVVEGMPYFQEAMAREPTATAVYYDEGAEEYLGP
jgi:hypothetical protein